MSNYLERSQVAAASPASNSIVFSCCVEIDVYLVYDARLSLSRWLRLLKSLEARGWPS
jgi:hypothetical protein